MSSGVNSSRMVIPLSYQIFFLHSLKTSIYARAQYSGVLEAVYANLIENATLSNVYAEEYPEEVGTPYSFVIMTEL